MKNGKKVGYDSQAPGAGKWLRDRAKKGLKKEEGNIKKGEWVPDFGPQRGGEK